MVTEEPKIKSQAPSESGSDHRDPQVVALQHTRRPWRLRLLVGLVVLLAAGVTWWWWVGRAHAPMSYTTVTALRGSVVKAVTATGTVNPELTIMVGSYVSGVIQTLTCDYNTQVKKGQLCAKIDPRPYQTVVDQDLASVATAKAQLEKDKASLAYAKLAYGRATSLLKDGVVSQDAFDNAKSTYDQLQAQVSVDESSVDERQAELNTAQVNLGYTNITSPVNGTVVLRNVTIGQTVAASFQTPTLFLIATDLTKMQVDTNVSESDIGSLREKDRVSFTVQAFPNRTFKGAVVQVRQSPQTVQNVVTYDIVVAVDNRDLMLKPGMTATTRIVADERTDVLRVPDQALRYVPGGLSAAGSQTPSSTESRATSSASKGSPVWVLREGNPTRVDVKLGLDDDSFTEIVGGDLKVGDQVITSEQAGGTQRKGTYAPTIPRF